MLIEVNISIPSLKAGMFWQYVWAIADHLRGLGSATSEKTGLASFSTHMLIPQFRNGSCYALYCLNDILADTDNSHMLSGSLILCWP